VGSLYVAAIGYFKGNLSLQFSNAPEFYEASSSAIGMVLSAIPIR
jgi:hypothetical protein